MVGWLVNKITQKAINRFERYFTCGLIYRRNKQGITSSFIGQNIKHIKGGIIDKMEEIQLKYIEIYFVDNYFHDLRHRILDTTNVTDNRFTETYNATGPSAAGDYFPSLH